MKRYIIILLYTLFSTILLHSQQYISLCKDSTECTYDGIPTRSIEYEDNSIIVTYNFDSAIIFEDPLFPNCYTWEYKGCGLIDIAGKPSLPISKDAFSLSHYSSVEIIDTSYIEIPIELSPARPPLIDNSNISHTIENVDTITPYAGFFPENVVEAGEIEYFKDKGLLWVNIYPLQYDTEHKVVKAYTTIKYKITTFNNTEQSNIRANSRYDYTIIDNIALNGRKTPQHINIGYIENNQDYVIISTNDYKAVCDTFATWKRTLGYRTHVILQDSWTTTQVKEEIMSLYNNPDINLNYLLIIGDENVVPAYYKSYNNKTYPTDLYYGCMDGENDKLPDIHRGRILANSVNNAQNVLNKIINYESSPTQDSLFYNTALHCACFEDKSPKDNYADRRFAETSEDIKNYMEIQNKVINRVYFTADSITPTNWNIDRFSYGDEIPFELQKPQFEWNGNHEQICDIINEGSFYVLFRGHGVSTSWAEPSFSKYQIQSSLSNGSKTPIVFSMTCNTGKYGQNLTCFAEEFLYKEDGGCVNIFAATDVSYSGYNDALILGIFSSIWPEPGIVANLRNFNNDTTSHNQPLYEMGRILDQGILTMKNAYGGYAGAELCTQEVFHCFGDPSMQLYTEIPKQIVTPEISRIDNKIYVKLMDGPARVSFYNHDTQKVDAFLGNNIEYITTTNNISICISRHNYIPYITTSVNTIYIQNETICEDRQYNTTNLYVGKNVTNKKSQGNVIFNGATIDINSKNVIFAPGTIIKNGTKVNITNL